MKCSCYANTVLFPHYAMQADCAYAIYFYNRSTSAHLHCCTSTLLHYTKKTLDKHTAMKKKAALCIIFFVPSSGRLDNMNIGKKKYVSY